MIVRKILLYILVLAGCAAYALPNVNQRRKKQTHNDERIVLRHADNLRFSEYEMNKAQRLSGNVILALGFGLGGGGVGILVAYPIWLACKGIVRFTIFTTKKILHFVLKGDDTQ